MPQRVSAVRVACAGEAKNAIKEYETYNILASHDIFVNGYFSQLSQFVGVPLLLQKLRPSLLQNVAPTVRTPIINPGRKYSSNAEDRYYPNPVASTLMVQLPSLAPPVGWEDHVGSVLIARADKKPLHPVHLAIFVGFAQAAAQQNRDCATPFEEMLIPSQFKLYIPMAVQALKESKQYPDDTENVAPLYDEEGNEQGMDVETGGVEIG